MSKQATANKMAELKVLRDNGYEIAMKNLPKLIGKGYGEFWRFKGRYRVVKGSRASKKSTTMQIEVLVKMMHYYHVYGVKPNALMIRRFYNTHRDSTYAQLLWAANLLGVSHLWTFKSSPLEATYKESGQKILFRGMDDPYSITSITVEQGHLCWVYWEEAYQIQNEDDFNKIDLSIRGELPYPLYKQHTLIFNPWSDKIWIKGRFFDQVDPKTGKSDDGKIMAITRNYDVNEFLSLDDIELFEEMKVKNPRRYAIEGLGQWGVAEGLIYENWRAEEFDIQAKYDERLNNGKRKHRLIFGLDFGYSIDPTAFVAAMVDERNYRIYIFAEMYGTRMTNRQIADKIKDMGFGQDIIMADSADPRTINELKLLGLTRIRGVKKGKNSILSGIQVLQDYEIVVHPRCSNVMVELSNYVYAKDRRTGELLNKPEGDFDHAMDALRYASSGLRKRTFSFPDEL